MFEFVRQIWAMVRPYKVRFALGLLCGVLSGLFAPALPLAAKFVMQVVFSSRGDSGQASLAAPTPSSNATNAAPAGSSIVPLGKLPKSLDFLNRWAEKIAPPGQVGAGAKLLVIATVPLVMLIRGLLAYFNVYLMSWVGVRAIQDLRLRVFQHLMGLSMGFFGRTSTGELFTRLGEVSYLQSTITNSVATVIRDPVTVISLLAVLLWQQTTLTLLTLLVFPVCLVPIVIYGRKVRKTTHAQQANAVDLSKLMVEAFVGNRIVRAYNLQSMVIEQFREATRRAISFAMRVVRAQEIPGPLIEFVAAIGVALFLLYFAFRPQVHQGPAELLQFVVSIFFLYPPVKALSRLHGQVAAARVIADRLQELLKIKNDVLEPADPKPLQAAGADIRFENIDFNYGEKPVLRGINLTVKAGTVVALVGPSGSGKTTLTNLLLRFYDPQHGRICIGRTDIRDVTTHDLRSQIAVVTQETILFNTTIRQNIGFGRPGASNQEIEAAARHAFAHEFIIDKTLGYESVIGERGMTLSGGQRQRIAIARAVVRQAPILILDEAMSALDTESERIIQAAFDDLMRGRTTICIAHRLSTVQSADLIVVIDQGRIVEQGRHAELLKQQGLYQKLYELQFQS